MGFLSDLVEDVLETTEKIVRAPVRVICAVDNHAWKAQLDGSYRCSNCGKTQKP